MASRRLIAIVGPTASGKSGLALRLAERTGGEIVSCDSLQVYRGFDVGSAKPDPSELRRVRHHLVDVASPDEPFNAADWARLARAAIDEIASRGRLPIVAGGTGMYLRALLEGVFEGPGADEVLRARLDRWAERFGARRLHRLLRRVDPDSAGRIEPADYQRIQRALEVYGVTGQPISRLQREHTRPLSGWDVAIVGLDPARPLLRAAVEARTEAMFRRGLLDEVRALLARYPAGLKPLQSIGYRQAIAAVRGELTVEQAARDIVTATMQYAKRQRTWFRHQARVTWFAEPEAALGFACSWLREDGA